MPNSYMWPLVVCLFSHSICNIWATLHLKLACLANGKIIFLLIWFWVFIVFKIIIGVLSITHINVTFMETTIFDIASLSSCCLIKGISSVLNWKFTCFRKSSICSSFPTLVSKLLYRRIVLSLFVTFLFSFNFLNVSISTGFLMDWNSLLFRDFFNTNFLKDASCLLDSSAKISKYFSTSSAVHGLEIFSIFLLYLWRYIFSTVKLAE